MPNPKGEAVNENNPKKKRDSVTNLRNQMLELSFMDAMRSAQPPIATDTTFRDLLKRLDEAEKKQH